MISEFDDKFVVSILGAYGNNLKSINLSNNELQSLANIEKFALYVEVLDLSYNRLKDVHKLQSLLELRDLNLAHNLISDVDGLQYLYNLQVLHLEHNSINSKEHIKSLSQLRSLHTLYLHGNPLCSDPSYPSSIFDMLPQVQEIDNIRRKLSAVTTHSTLVPTSSKQLSSSSSFTQVVHPVDMTSSTSTCTSEEINSLKNKIHALEDLISYQEKIVAKNGLDIATSLYHQQKQRNKYDDENIDTSNRSKPKDDTITISDIQSFPYVKLLNSWRKQTFNLIYEKLELESKLKSLTSKYESKHLEVEKTLSNLQSIHNNQQNEQFINNEHIQSLENRIQYIEYSLSLETEKRIEYETKYFKTIRMIQQLERAVIDMREIMDQKSTQLNLLMMKGLDKLSDMENRLVAATQRIHTAEILVSQKEIILRNSMVAIEAERRWSYLSPLPPQSQPISSQQSTSLLVPHTKDHHSSNGYKKGIYSKQDQGIIQSKAAMKSPSPSHELEKDIYHHHHHQPRHPYTHTTDVSEILMTREERDDEKVVHIHTSKYLLSDIILKPEVECFIRSIFRLFDPEDTGLVSLQLLYDCFISSHNNNNNYYYYYSNNNNNNNNNDDNNNNNNNYSNDNNNNNNDDDNNDDDIHIHGDNIRNKSGKVIDHDILQLRNVIESAIGSVLYHVLILSIDRYYHIHDHQLILPSTTMEIPDISTLSEDRTVTWGEFLLMLVPSEDNYKTSSSSYTRNNALLLSHEDMVNMHEAKVWQDEEWSMIPLQLPLTKVTSADSAVQTTQNVPYSTSKKMSSEHTTAEITRLSHERSFLLSRLQYMIRTLDRRTEIIKGYFESSISQSRLRESRLQAQLTEMKNELMVEKDHFQQQELSHQTYITQLLQKLEEIEKECDMLRQQKQVVVEDSLTQYDQLLANERNNSRKLETEYNLLQREHSRNEVKIKGLQRDVLRLQTALSAALEESQQNKNSFITTQATLQELTTQQHYNEVKLHEYENAQVTWSEEKEQYELRIQQLEHQLQLATTANTTSTSSTSAANVNDVMPLVRGNVDTEVQIKINSSSDIMKSTSVEPLSTNKVTLSPVETRLREEMEFIKNLPSSQYKYNPPATTTVTSISPSTKPIARSVSPSIHTCISPHSALSKVPTHSSGIDTSSVPAVSSSSISPDMYSTHLNKLLKLAEDLITKN